MNTPKLDKIALDEKLKKIVLELSEFDYEKLDELNNFSLFNGYAGLSLFFHNLYFYTKNEEHYNKAFFYFEKVYNRLSFSNINFSYGASGVMWLIDYYRKEKAFSMNFEEFLLHFDKKLESRLDEYAYNIDPMHGLLGISNYLFQRENDYANKSLCKMLQILNKRKNENNNTTFWESGVDSTNKNIERHVNFGYAHGIPAILTFLSKLIKRNINLKLSQKLFSSTYKYFIQYYNDTEPTYFPSHVQNDLIRKNQRIAYCYGDLSISCGLAIVGKNCGSIEITKLAKKCALNIATLSIDRKEEFSDIGLCHGAAGNAFMFSKLYKTFGNKILKKASILQFENLTYLKKENVEIAGFQSLNFNDETQMFSKKVDASFINGTTGIGLSILSHLNSRKKNNWDSILYLS